jgi:5-hydroxyisourate hydrolase
MSTSQVTTHILDTAAGRPAPGVDVALARLDGGTWTPVGNGTTDADGRVGSLGPEQVPPGTYRLTFGTGPYYERLGTPAFFPEVDLVFSVTGTEHYHVPLLLSPFAYSTYRGS